MNSSLKSRKGFTLIEVAMAIALVAIGLTVGVLGYNGYQAWAAETAAKENAQNLVSAVAQARALGEAPTLADSAGATITVTEANAIYAQIDGDITPDGASAPVQIVPAGFQLPASATFPSGFRAVGGLLTPLP